MDLPELCCLPWTSTMVPFLLETAVAKATHLIPCSTPSRNSPSQTASGRAIPPLLDFVRGLVYATHTIPVTILTGMALLERLGSKLPARVSGSAETCHRVILAALILANKLLYDVPMKNVVWADYTGGLYSVSEINLMEKQFLEFIDFNTNVKDEELFHQYTLATDSKGYWSHSFCNEYETPCFTPNHVGRTMTPTAIRPVPIPLKTASSDHIMAEFFDWTHGGSSSLVDNSPTSYLSTAPGACAVDGSHRSNTASSSPPMNVEWPNYHIVNGLQYPQPQMAATMIHYPQPSMIAYPQAVLVQPTIAVQAPAAHYQTQARPDIFYAHANNYWNARHSLYA